MFRSIALHLADLGGLTADMCHVFEGNGLGAGLVAVLVRLSRTGWAAEVPEDAGVA